MKQITVERPKEFFNKYADYKVVIDGQTIGTIGNNKTKQFTIPEDAKTIQLKIHYVGSEKESLTNLKNVVVRANKSLHRSLIFTACLPLIFLLLSNLFHLSKATIISLFLVFVLGIIVSITIGKNNWLEVKHS